MTLNEYYNKYIEGFKTENMMAARSMAIDIIVEADILVSLIRERDSEEYFETVKALNNKWNTIIDQFVRDGITPMVRRNQPINAWDKTFDQEDTQQTDHRLHYNRWREYLPVFVTIVDDEDGDAADPEPEEVVAEQSTSDQKYYGRGQTRDTGPMEDPIY